MRYSLLQWFAIKKFSIKFQLFFDLKLQKISSLSKIIFLCSTCNIVVIRWIFNPGQNRVNHQSKYPVCQRNITLWWKDLELQRGIWISKSFLLIFEKIIKIWGPVFLVLKTYKNRGTRFFYYQRWKKKEENFVRDAETIKGQKIHREVTSCLSFSTIQSVERETHRRADAKKSPFRYSR